MKVIIDTNVLLSGIFWAGGPPGRIIQDWLNGRFTVIVSREIIDEYRALIMRLSLKKGVDVSRIMERLLMQVEFVFPINLVSGICRDPSDDKFLAAAASGRVKFIITGDRDLLDVGRFRRTQIVTPANFVAAMKR